MDCFDPINRKGLAVASPSSAPTCLYSIGAHIAPYDVSKLCYAIHTYWADMQIGQIFLSLLNGNG